MIEDIKKFIETENFTILNDYIKSGKFSHAIMLSSNDNFANFNLAMLMALSIFQNGEIDLTKSDLIKIAEKTHPDVKFLPVKESFLVSDADIIQEESFIKPVYQEKKIFIINNIDKSTIQAQNKLLKIIEEPPMNVVFIFTCQNMDLVLQTIKSRVQKFILKPFSINEMKLFVEDNDKLNDILLIANGNIGKAKEYSEDENIFEAINLIKDMALNLKSSKKVLYYSSKMIAKKENFIFILSILQELFMDMLFIKENKSSLVIHKEIAPKVEKEFTKQAILNIIDKINQTKKEYDANVSINILCDNLLMNILEEKYYGNQSN